MELYIGYKLHNTFGLLLFNFGTIYPPNGDVYDGNYSNIEEYSYGCNQLVYEGFVSSIDFTSGGRSENLVSIKEQL